MNITRFAIENNRITGITLLVILLSGIGAYINMPRNEDPGFIIRTALVRTFFPGASPERVEQLVTDKLEKVIQEIPELDAVRSESKTGTSIIWVDIQERYTKMRPIWDNLRRKVEKAVPDLPDGVLGPYVNDEFGDVYGILITLIGDGFSYSELKDVADDVRDELLRLLDVAKVEISGDQEERIFVEYNNARLAELGISPIQLQQMLAAKNIIIPGGDITTANEKIVLEPSGNFESFEEIRRTVINIPGTKEVLLLEDVVDLKRGYIDPPETMMRATGERALNLAVSMREGGNLIDLGTQVKQVIQRAESLFPIGIEFDFIQYQPGVVKKKVDDFVSNLIQAVVIVAGVMLLTLGLRTGLVVASLIPMAMVMNFLAMSFLDIGLDQMSLAALIIALGLLVDNAIVMSESTMVQMAAGKPPIEAAINSANELRIPLLTSSLTTAAAFLPIYLAESNAGEYTAPIFKVVTITLLCSWILALTMIPLLCVHFLRVPIATKADPFQSPFYIHYRKSLLGMLRHPWVTMGVVVGVFVMAMMGFSQIPAIFFPPNDRPTFTAEIELSTGTPIEKTESVVKSIEDFIKNHLLVNDERHEGITNWGAYIGQGAPRFVLPYGPEQARPEYAFMLLNTTSRQIFDVLIPQLETFCTNNFPDLKATIRPLDSGPPAWPPIEVRISGRDTDVLFNLVDEVKDKLASIPGTRLIDDDWGARSKKIIVNVNQPRALRAGVTSQDIAISLQTFLTGLDTTEYREDDKLVPVTLRSVGADRQDIGKLETINVYAQATGQSVPLISVADLNVVWQPAKIKRRDRLRTVTVEAAMDQGVTASDVNQVLEPWLREQEKNWGLGYFWEFGGEAETSGKAQKSIQDKLPVAGLIILLLLVSQFNSVRRPVIILLTIPLGLIGVVFGLLVTHSYFGFMTLLGIISLAGIVINNAIVLLDRIKIEREINGLSPQQAIIESAQRRFRPILLTTVTTIGGLLPLWLGGGPMWEPMAISIMFGLLVATVLTLGVVPVLYTLFFRLNFKSFRG